ncbi:hypothetical protein SIM91_43500 [Rhodococcus opacus]|uniref:hypothetical protein n=1 Tax=Rhodococcus opacus TaxID=37919 RepID=UPI0002A3FF49|nr:hypothetical protein [Rhodococcus opacus]ELB92163.1 hypothetical protein Rwratislav_15473 [Rhodococcus wratislaviensis IFP 2016]MDX5970028.1 hypothetical protein [Rhodococcus opacus]CAG7634652.1 hypothetical protein E143388_07626 [Rhodococcus opacus]
MKRILHVLISVALCALAVVVFLTVFESSRDTTPRPLAEETFTIGGRPATCSALFGQPCDYTLQSEFNRWGSGLESFVESSPLGSYAADIGFVASAKLSLRACGLARTVGKTFLEFEALARRDHPDATSPQLFPFWNRTRQGLCPTR